MTDRLSTLEILKSFHQITGARISLHDLNLKEIAAYPAELHPFCTQVQRQERGAEQCSCADSMAFNTVRSTGKPHLYKCHCGLIEAIAPIYNYGVLTGYFMMGQLMSDDNGESLNVLRLSAQYFSCREDAVDTIATIPTTNYDSMEIYFKLLVIISEYMTQTNRLTDNTGDLASATKAYIHRFYSSRISVSSMCDHLSCSRTTLMNTFRTKYGMTIGAYLSEYRLQMAERMLTKSGKSIKSIAMDCGFSDQNYFTKVFSKHYGSTPSDYRLAAMSKQS